MESAESGAENSVVTEPATSRVPKRLIATIVWACVAGIIVALILSAPKLSVKLPDGSVLKLEGASYSTNEFVVGRWFERTVYRLTRRRLGSKILGIQFWPPVVTPLTRTGAPTADPYWVHLHFTHTKDPPIGSSSSSGNTRGVVFNGTLIEVFAENGRRLQSHGVMASSTRNSAYNRLSFESPGDEAEFLRAQLSRPNTSGEFVRLAEFTVENPAHKNRRK